MIHWTAVAAVVLVGGLFVVSRVLFVLLRRVGAGFTAIQLLLILLEPVAVGVAYSITIVTEPGQVAAAAVGSTLVAVAVNALVASVVGFAGLFVLKRNRLRAGDALRPDTVTIPDRVRRRDLQTLFTVAVAAALVAEAIRLGVVGVSNAWTIPAIGVVWTVYVIRTNYFRLPPLNENLIRDPTDEERERIEACYERFGRSPGWIVVAEDAKIGANVVGRGAFHSVGVTETFLERVDDTTLALALAQADERSANGYWTLYICITLMAITTLSIVFLVWPAFLLGLFTTSIPLFWFLIPLPVAFILAPSLVWLGRRSVYDADTFVVSQFDTSTVAKVYRKLGDELQYHRLAIKSLNRYMSLDPTIEQRLERLGIKSLGDTAEPDD